MRKLIQITAATAALLLLAGCAPEASPGGLSGDKRTVADLALTVDEETRDRLGDTAEVVDVYEWKDGYAVLIRTDGENKDGDYSNFHAYGYEPEGDSWALENDRSVDASFDPQGEPAVATCMALADEYEEREACAQIEK